MSTVFKREQDDAAYRIFVHNIETLLGPQNDIEKIVCFHDVGFSERHAIVTYDALRNLEKIHQQLIDDCPAWLDKDGLNTVCERHIRMFLGLMLANHQFKDVLHLLRHARFRKLVFELITRKMRTLTKRSNV